MTTNPLTEREQLQARLIGQANYLDTFGETSDGKLMRDAARQLELDHTVELCLMAALQGLAGDKIDNVTQLVVDAMHSTLERGRL